MPCSYEHPRLGPSRSRGALVREDFLAARCRILDPGVTFLVPMVFLAVDDEPEGVRLRAGPVTCLADRNVEDTVSEVSSTQPSTRGTRIE